MHESTKLLGYATVCISCKLHLKNHGIDKFQWRYGVIRVLGPYLIIRFSDFILQNSYKWM